MAAAEVGQPNLQEAAAFLAEHMGRRLFTRTMGVHSSTVRRWLSGDSAPSRDAAERVLGTFAIWQTVAEVESPETVRAWFMGMKDALQDYSPCEVIAAGRIADVAAVARAYVQRA
jgi:hypothetical protein